MKKVIYYTSKILFSLIVALALILTTSAFMQKAKGIKLPMTFGWGNAFILTGSMEPAIPVRSIVFIHDTDDIEQGDIVTYIAEDTSLPVTHRVKEISGNTVITQGDANNTIDTPFTTSQILGKVVLILPPNIYRALPLGALIVVFLFFFSEKRMIPTIQDRKRK